MEDFIVGYRTLTAKEHMKWMAAYLLGTALPGAITTATGLILSAESPETFTSKAALGVTLAACAGLAGLVKAGSHFIQANQEINTGKRELE